MKKLYATLVAIFAIAQFSYAQTLHGHLQPALVM